MILIAHSSNPEDKDYEQKIMPNGLRYIAAVLKENNHDVQLVNFSGMGFEGIKEKIKELGPEMIGLGCYTYNRHTILKICEIVKSVNKDIKTILGGPHATLMYEQILANYKDVDVIVIGEGEETFLDIANNKVLENIKGIAYRGGKTEQREPICELDKLPLPSKYFSYRRLITSRGCPGNCIFCCTPAIWGTKLRFRSAKNIVDELEALNKKGISFFVFSDDTFTAKKDRLIDICKEILDRKLNIVWDCRSRVNFIDEERLFWMKKAGCISISYGIESGSEKILKNISKGITKEQIIKASELTRLQGIQMNFYLIVGSPGETEETIKETIEILEKCKPQSIIVSYMQITPGTRLNKTSNLEKEFWLESKEQSKNYIYEHDMKTLQKFRFMIEDYFNKKRYNFYYTEDFLKQLLEKQENSTDHNNLGLIYLKNKKAQKAINHFEKAIQLNKGMVQSYLNIGVILAKIGQIEPALDFFKKAIVMNPEDSIAYNNIGKLHHQAKKFSLAVNYFLQAINLNPSYADAYCNLGVSFDAIDKKQEAIDAFKQAIIINPFDVSFYNNLAAAYGKNKQYKEAMNILKKALVIDKNNKTTLNFMKITLEKLKG